MLELQAGAGMYTHIDGRHSRIAMGQYKIGLIALERQPHVTNSVIGDPRVHDQEWAKKEGIISFAGYPLILEEKLVGVMAIYSRQALSAHALRALGSVANGISLGIERKQIEEERENLILKLQNTLAKIKTLSGLLPICSSCKKIRDDKGYWTQIEAYIHEHSEADFSHGLYPECAKQLYPEYYKKIWEKFDR